MPTEVPAALFLFAHQDDEFGMLHRIRSHVRRGERVRCAYLTDGATGGVTSAVRNAESLKVLARLGVSAADVSFAGEQLGIGDGRLPEHLAAAARWLGEWFAAAPEAAVYVPAWEGGHHDHDALHAVAVHVAAAQGRLERTWQFPLYNGWKMPAPLFRVLSPLPANGPVLAETIPWRERTGLLRQCLAYPSQAKTWIGLFPFVLLHYAFKGTESLQRVDPRRTRERPHPGRLYYEVRQFSTWEAMAARLSAALGAAPEAAR